MDPMGMIPEKKKLSNANTAFHSVIWPDISTHWYSHLADGFRYTEDPQI